MHERASMERGAHASATYDAAAPVAQGARRRRLRLFIVFNLALATWYLTWRYTASIYWAHWPVALALLAAETYSFVDAWLFSLTMWRWRQRSEPPPPLGALPGETPVGVDVFITTYNEPVELVRTTLRAAQAISYPHRVALLDDGARPAMRALAEEAGAGYIVRSEDWTGRARHAKSGNINNALMQTTGEFILILDADQIPEPSILDRTLGYFRDPRVAFVQTPQWFYNAPPDDPLGARADLFYGPIQQGKDGWNAAFFCGSNGVLRREALMQVGLAYYVRDLEARVGRVLGAADRLLARARRDPATRRDRRVQDALRELRATVREARRMLRDGAPINEATWRFQQRARAIARGIVSADLAAISADLADLPDVDPEALAALATLSDDEEALAALAERDRSPLAAIAAVRDLLLAVDVDRADEAQPVMPFATVSITEDMATSMRLHGRGWRSVYHDEALARGLAPDDLSSSFQQRLRWAQGTLQVLLRENPLVARGLSLGQRLMYFATMWSYLSGPATLVYLTAPILYLAFGLRPVDAYGADFFIHLLSFLAANRLFMLAASQGRPTWRGEQYTVALFPLWIQAIVGAVGNVFFGRRLRFVVTPKTRQGRPSPWLIWPQLLMMALLIIGVLVGLARLALGLGGTAIGVAVNSLWIVYDLAALAVLIPALRYQPAEAADCAATTGPRPLRS
jgi:cellulose synthase (UDP-forming)